uniref:RT_RNaseH domain-containing protein n=1 Tax=Strongyloides venezuelensis TaxID=75913 RepID=A0A0K0F041_STRVS
MEDLVLPVRKKFDGNLHAIIVYLDNILVLSITDQDGHKPYHEVVNLIHSNSPIQLRDHSKKAFMKVNAPQLCIGAILLQESDNSENKEVLFRKKYLPICYYSEMLSSTKKARATTYLELYTIKKALIFFSPLISQEELTVYYDHELLEKVLKHNVTPRYVDLTDAIALFSIKIHLIIEKNNSLSNVLPNVCV